VAFWQTTTKMTLIHYQFDRTSTTKVTSGNKENVVLRITSVYKRKMCIPAGIFIVYYLHIFQDIQYITNVYKRKICIPALIGIFIAYYFHIFQDIKYLKIS
jgi:hypothetical protein